MRIVCTMKKKYFAKTLIIFPIYYINKFKPFSPLVVNLLRKTGQVFDFKDSSVIKNGLS